MVDPDIVREEDGQSGRYVARLGSGVSEAEMTFSRPQKDVMIIHRTWVPEACRGHNIAAKLVLRAVEDAKEMGFRIRSQCSYVDWQFEQHPEWQGLLSD